METAIALQNLVTSFAGALLFELTGILVLSSFIGASAWQAIRR